MKGDLDLFGTPEPMTTDDYLPFFEACRVAGLPLFSHDYFAGLSSETSQRATGGDASAIQELSVVELRSFVVWLSRGDRWTDGFWAGVTVEGLPQAVLRRIHQDRSKLPYEPAVPNELIFN